VVARAGPHHRAARAQDEHVRAEARDACRHLVGGPLADRDHGDDGGDTDDDAEHGQEGAERVAQDRLEREAHGFPDHRAALRAGIARSEATRPSMKVTSRPAWAAMSSSCVTMTMVMPSSRLSRTSSSMISRER